MTTANVAPQPHPVPFNSLVPGLRAIRGELDRAIQRVLDSGMFVLGSEGGAFEAAFASYHGRDYQAIGVASGTDALRLGLQALGVVPGDDVLVVANAGVPPVAAVVAAGARPIFCDVDPESHTLAPDEIERRATPRTRALVVVHLYGRAADVDAIRERAGVRHIKILEDCAQAHGARQQGRLAGTLGDAAAFSFYPTKNLGALGDGGALLTADARVADRARLLRNYGWRHKYVSEIHSTNSRLDELQAAVLSAKLPYLEQWNERRRTLANLYESALAEARSIGCLMTPPMPPAGDQHVYHLYVTRVDAALRSDLQRFLAARGVGTDVHYPVPVHLQGPYATVDQPAGSLPVTEQLADEVLSLPLYPHLADADARYVAAQVTAFCQERT